MTLRAGILGGGRIGWAYDRGAWDGRRSVSHAACFARHPDTRLVALCDPVAEARAAFDAGYAGPGPVRVTADLAEFLALELDVVSIASPSARHAEHVAACFDAGIPRLWVEKPVTLSLQDLDALLDRAAALAAAPRLQVNYFRRALPQVAEMKRRLQAVPPAACEITYSRGLAVNGVHLLDLLGFLFDAAAPAALDWLRPDPSGNPDFGFTLGGMPVTVTGHDLPYHAIEIRVTGASGRLSLRQGGARLVHEAAEPNPDYPGFFRLGDPVSAFDPGAAERAMRDGSYLMLCDLLQDGAAPVAPLGSARIAQVLLDLAEKAPA